MPQSLTKEERVMSKQRKAFQKWLGDKDYICLPDSNINHMKRGEHRHFAQKDRYTKL